MISVDSLQKPNIPKIIGLVIALVLCVGLVVGVLSSLGGSAKKETIKPATSTSLPETLKQLISVSAYPVSQPSVIPKGYRRTNVEIIAASRSASGCEEILQSYQRTPDADVSYIDVYAYAATCAFPRPADAEKYSVGDYSGWISDPGTKSDETGQIASILYELTINQGVIRVETDLSQKQIAPVLKKFVVFSDVPPRDSVPISNK